MRKSLALGVSLLALCSPASGETTASAPLLAEMFGDHAVLQRDRPVAIWGRATPGVQVSVTLGKSRAAARADKNGRWQVMLPPQPASSGLTLVATSSDGARQQLAQVALGDVFLCSGQSNMEWTVRQALDADRTIATAADDGLRLLHVDHQHGPGAFPALKLKAGWTAASPASVPDFSAACYFMGRELRKALQVPVGLVAASWGGSTIQSWMSTDALHAFGGFGRQLEVIALRQRDPAAAGIAWTELWQQWWRSASGNQQGEPWRDPLTPAWQPVPAFTPWQSWGDRSLEAYHATLWYRTSVTLTPEQAAQPATLHLGQIDEIDHSWVNGRPVGTTEERGRERAYPLPPGTLRAGTNSVVLNVFDGWTGGGMLGPAGRRAIRFADGTQVMLDGEWRYLRPPGSAEWPPRAPWSALSGFGTIANGMIAPLAPYTLRGVAWYQGESNVGEADRYDRLLAAWMADWRRWFAQPDLPFLIVQLSSFGAPAADQPTDEGWGRLRDAQRRAVEADKRAALVVTHDLGERTDIHPANKQLVGLRLARAARAAIYGQAVTPSGPLPISAQLEPQGVRIRFRDAGAGLTTYSARTAIGFELCDLNGRCRFTDGRVEGRDSVLLTTESGSTPASVRFCWANGPVCNLYDHGGMPVTSFEQQVAN